MAARRLTYYEFDPGARIDCAACGWSGAASDCDTEYFDALFDVSCPKCEQMLLIVSYPTIDETKAAAARGNPRAIEEMDYVVRIEDFRSRFEREALRETTPLPEVEGETLRFVWDFTCDKGELNARTIIKLDGRVIWNEPAIYEGADRFREVKALLKDRYGHRFASLIPTRRSQTWLFGDGVDHSEIPEEIFADPPDEIARLRSETRGSEYHTIWLRLGPSGDLTLETEDNLRRTDELDWTWSLPASQQDKLLDTLELGRPDPLSLLEQLSGRLRALTTEQIQECFERAGAEFWGRADS